MQHLEVRCAVRRLFKSLGFKGLMYVVSWCRSTVPGFEPYLLGKIRQVEMVYLRMNLSLKRRSFCGSMKRMLRSDCSIPVTTVHSFIHNSILTQTNSHIQHSH